jgi:hypothetical protein
MKMLSTHALPVQMPQQANYLALLPYNASMQLANKAMKLKVLHLMAFLVNETIQAIESFMAKKSLLGFDAHIGDTLCQIRAYKLLLIADNYYTKSGFLFLNGEKQKLIKTAVSLQNVISTFERLIGESKGKYQKELDAQEGLANFIENHSLSFELSETVLFLTQTRLLTAFSIIDSNGLSIGVNYGKLCQKAAISKTLAKNLMHYFQQSLAKLSCEFITDLLTELEGDYFASLRLLLSCLQKTDADKREVLPCYEVTRIILAHLVKQNYPVLIVAKQQGLGYQHTHYLLFKPDHYTDNLAFVDLLDLDDMASPCVVIQGITGLSKEALIYRIEQLGLLNILFANMAIHPQYSAKELETTNPYQDFFSQGNNAKQQNNNSPVNYACPLRPLDRLIAAVNKCEAELLNMQQLALEKSCHIEDPSLFLVQHIFCDNLAQYRQNYGKSEQLAQPHDDYKLLSGSLDVMPDVLTHYYH